MHFPTIEDYVGHTPLVRLQRLPGETSNVILAKLEGNNPAGSVKDRPAISMIQEAERRGEIKPGDTLIEATSGNTGIALAMAAASCPTASATLASSAFIRCTISSGPSRSSCSEAGLRRSVEQAIRQSEQGTFTLDQRGNLPRCGKGG